MPRRTPAPWSRPNRQPSRELTSSPSCTTNPPPGGGPRCTTSPRRLASSHNLQPGFPAANREARNTKAPAQNTAGAFVLVRYLNLKCLLGSGAVRPVVICPKQGGQAHLARRFRTSETGVHHQ